MAARFRIFFAARAAARSADSSIASFASQPWYSLPAGSPIILYGQSVELLLLIGEIRGQVQACIATALGLTSGCELTIVHERSGRRTAEYVRTADSGAESCVARG